MSTPLFVARLGQGRFTCRPGHTTAVLRWAPCDDSPLGGRPTDCGLRPTDAPCHGKLPPSGDPALDPCRAGAVTRLNCASIPGVRNDEKLCRLSSDGG